MLCKGISYLQLWCPFCSEEQNYLCNCLLHIHLLATPLSASHSLFCSVRQTKAKMAANVGVASRFADRVLTHVSERSYSFIEEQTDWIKCVDDSYYHDVTLFINHEGAYFAQSDAFTNSQTDLIPAVFISVYVYIKPTKYRSAIFLGRQCMCG